jgi:hypothetical protein
MKTRTRWLLIFVFVACQVTAFFLLFPNPAYADDCLRDPLNAADCMRTTGARQVGSVVISLAGTLAATLVSIVSSATSAVTTAAATTAATATTIYGTGTPDDPYRDISAFKVGKDGKIERYPEMQGKPLNIYGTGTPDNPYTDVPDTGQTTKGNEPNEPDEGVQTPDVPVQTAPEKAPQTQVPPPPPAESPTSGSQTTPPELQTPPEVGQTPPGIGSPPVQTPVTPLPVAPVVPAPPPPAPATPQSPPTPSVKTDGISQPSSQKDDWEGEDEGEGEEGEGEGEEPKDTLHTAKEAAENYGKNLEDLSGKLEKIKEHFEHDPNLSPEAKEKFKKYIDSFTESLGKVKEHAEAVSEGIGQITDPIDQIKDLTKSLDKNLQEIAAAHQQALENLKDLPPDAANAAADLSAALDGFGRSADAALNKIPGYKELGGDKTFEVTKSFQEAGKGLQKAIRVIKTSEIEAKDLSKNGDSVPGYTPKTNYNEDPDVIKIRTEAAKNRPQSTWDWLKEKILGKTPDEKVKQFR